MSLIACHDCGSQVSTDSPTCIKCGAKLKTARNRFGLAGKVIWYAVCAFVLFVVWRVFFQVGSIL